MVNNSDSFSSQVTFQLICDIKPEDSIWLLGNINELHNWNDKNPINLKYNNELQLWKSETLDLPRNIPIEYKFIKVLNQKKVVWEEFPEMNNRSLFITNEKSLEITSIFGNRNNQIRDMQTNNEKLKEDDASMSLKFTLVIISNN